MDKQKFMSNIIELFKLPVEGVLYFTAIMCIFAVSVFVLTCFMALIVITSPILIIWLYKEFIRGK
jgi:hypothetical protein